MISVTEQTSIAISQGQEAYDRLDAATRHKLIEHLVKHTTQVPTTIIGRSRLLARELLSETNQTLGVLSDKFFARIANVLWPTRSLRERTAYIEQNLRDMAKDGNLFVAETDGRPAGMNGYILSGLHPHDGKPIFEIVRGSVLPKFEGQGISSALHTRIMDAIQDKHPDAYVMTYTKNPRIKQWAQKRGFRALDSETLHRTIWGMSEQEWLRLKSGLGKDGWQAFIIKLSEATPEPSPPSAQSDPPAAEPGSVSW